MDLMGDRQISEGIDSFEELFQAMSLMKSQASALEGADRKAYAEKMTMAFWQAIDGNPDEIEGLDSSADEDWKTKSFLFFPLWVSLYSCIHFNLFQLLKSERKTRLGQIRKLLFDQPFPQCWQKGISGEIGMPAMVDNPEDWQ